jgi:hypothetical protein
MRAKLGEQLAQTLPIWFLPSQLCRDVAAKRRHQRTPLVRPELRQAARKVAKSAKASGYDLILVTSAASRRRVTASDSTRI